VFGLSNAALPGPVMAQWYLSNEVKITEVAMQVEGPYLMSVNLTNRLRRIKLAYPPK
jgi:hypothetical protein